MSVDLILVGLCVKAYRLRDQSKRVSMEGKTRFQLLHYIALYMDIVRGHQMATPKCHTHGLYAVHGERLS